MCCTFFVVKVFHGFGIFIPSFVPVCFFHCFAGSRMPRALCVLCKMERGLHRVWDDKEGPQYLNQSDRSCSLRSSFTETTFCAAVFFLFFQNDDQTNWSSSSDSNDPRVRGNWRATYGMECVLWKMYNQMFPYWRLCSNFSRMQDWHTECNL